jgi:23S rRNA pseudouridine955/2504/2580 synthase
MALSIEDAIRLLCAHNRQVNSAKSSTYGTPLAAQIISTKARGSPRSPAGRQGEPQAPEPSAQVRVQQVVADEEDAGQRLDNFLIKRLKGVPKTHVYRIVRSGEVRVNGGRAAADTRIAAGDRIRVPPVRTAQRPAAPAIPPHDFHVLLEDDQLLAIDKPAGIAVHGGSGVSFGVIEQLRRSRPQARFLELVHRLDKETSGILLIAKRRSALAALQAQFRERQIGKVYAALVAGRWNPSHKVIDVALSRYLTAEGERRVRAVPAEGAGSDAESSARRSISLVKVVRQAAAFALLDVTIKTGRTHQIRVHLAGAGAAIVGDDKYGDFALNKALARGQAVAGIAPGARFDRMFLHARQLRFVHPQSGEPVTLDAPLPDDCRALLDRLIA